jgi:exonuclease III
MRLLSWNVRGLGDDSKNDTICKAIDEAKVDILCLQETKLVEITIFKARKFLPAKFTDFLYYPSDGASAGLLITWNQKDYNIQLRDSRRSALTVQVQSNSDDQNFVLTNIYAPCEHIEHSQFFSEIKHLQLTIAEPWVLAGDYNIYRYVSEKNNSNINWAAMDEFNA